MMSFLPVLVSNLKNLLSNPGDKLSAEITPKGNQVLKLVTSGVKHSAIRYKSGTIVETIVHPASK